MAVKRVLLKVRIFTKFCDLKVCILSVCVRDEVTLDAFKKLLGTNTEGYLLDDYTHQEPIFGIIAELLEIVHIEERTRKV